MRVLVLSVVATVSTAPFAGTLAAPGREAAFVDLFMKACLAAPLDLASVTARVSATAHHDAPSTVGFSDPSEASKSWRWVVDTASGPFTVDAGQYSGKDGTMRTCSVVGLAEPATLVTTLSSSLGRRPTYDGGRASVWETGERSLTMSSREGDPQVALRVVETTFAKPPTSPKSVP